MSRGYFDQHGNWVPEGTGEPTATCPECEVGKHGNCNSEAWDDERDCITNCACWADGHLVA